MQEMISMLAPQTKMEQVAALFDEYSGRVYGFFCYRVSDRQLAQDLTQIVFEKVVRKIRTFNPEKGNREVWLFAIARNVLRDHYRSPYSRPPTSLDALDTEVADPDDTARRVEQRELLACAMEALNRRELLAVSLKYGAGLKNKELAMVLRVKEKHVAVILHRSLKKMAARLEKEV